MPRIVLGSASRYRRELIERLGMGIECIASPFDEEKAKELLVGYTPEDFVTFLARGKAEALASEVPNGLIIGSDQVAVFQGEILGKPHTVEAACSQLRRLAGQTHTLVVAVAMYEPVTQRMECSVSTHTLVMRRLTDEEILEYVTRDSPLDCAGSYRVESLGIVLFERLSSDDFTGIIGLPLTSVVALLERFGVRVLSTGGRT